MSNDLLNTPKLGFGCMRLPLLDANDQTSIEELSALMVE